MRYLKVWMFAMMGVMLAINVNCALEGGVLFGDENGDDDSYFEEDDVWEECAGIGDSEFDAYEVAHCWWITEDQEVLDSIQDDEQLEEVLMILVEWEGEDEDIRGGGGLPGCGGFWGSYNFAGFAEYQTSGYSYYWSPNCYMSERDGACGGDGDNLVSFWMGPDYRSSQAGYRVHGTSSSVRLFLWVKGGGSFRQYESNAYGAWYANAYVCLPTYLNASALRFGRDY